MIIRAFMRKTPLARGVLAAAVLLSIYACGGEETVKPLPGPLAGPIGESDNEPPSVPLDLIAEAVSDSRMSIVWSPSTDNVGVEGYRVFRDGSVAGITPSTSYVDTGLASGTSYSYQVSAFDSAGNESARSGPATGTTSGGGSSGNTYVVGPARAYTSIQQVEALLEPGDLVLVDGDEVYPGGVTFSTAGTPRSPSRSAASGSMATAP